MPDEQDQMKGILVSFFLERLAPLTSTENPLFPTGPDAKAETYYIDRLDDSDYIFELDPANVASDLREMWAIGNLPELAELADEIVDLADQLQGCDEDKGEISPFVYAMF
ncbi:MAG: hypothetical protein ACR2IH_06890 [Pyrinomonadaceae bacterium]